MSHSLPGLPIQSMTLANYQHQAAVAAAGTGNSPSSHPPPALGVAGAAVGPGPASQAHMGNPLPQLVTLTQACTWQQSNSGGGGSRTAPAPSLQAGTGQHYVIPVNSPQLKMVGPSAMPISTSSASAPVHGQHNQHQRSHGFNIKDLLGSPVDSPQQQMQMGHSNVPPTPPAMSQHGTPSQLSNPLSPAGHMHSLASPRHTHSDHDLGSGDHYIGQPPPLRPLTGVLKGPGGGPHASHSSAVLSPMDMPSPQQQAVMSNLAQSPLQQHHHQQQQGQFMAPQYYHFHDRTQEQGGAGPRDQQQQQQQQQQLQLGNHHAGLAAAAHSMQRPSDISPMFATPLHHVGRHPGPTPTVASLPSHYAMHHIASPNSASGTYAAPYQMAAQGQGHGGTLSTDYHHHHSASAATALVLSPTNNHPLTVGLAPVNPYSTQSLHRYNSDLLRSDRHMFNKHQRAELEKEFLQNKYITKTERNRLANTLALKRKQVTTWFQNRRARERRRCRRQGMSPKWDPNGNGPGAAANEDDDLDSTPSEPAPGDDRCPEIMVTLKRESSEESNETGGAGGLSEDTSTSSHGATPVSGNSHVALGAHQAMFDDGRFYNPQPPGHV